MLRSTVTGPSAESTPYSDQRGALSAVCGSMPQSSMLDSTCARTVRVQVSRLGKGAHVQTVGRILPSQ